MKKPSATEIYDLCLDCAHEVYSKTRPTEKYAKQVAALLFGTLAQESGGFQHLRQIGFDWETNQGGFGLAQLQVESANETMTRLRKNHKLAQRSAVWLFQGGDADGQWFMKYSSGQMLRLFMMSNPLAILFARLHYIWFAELVPQSIEEQASYWKKYFNTEAGRGKVGDYLTNWILYCEKIVRRKEL